MAQYYCFESKYVKQTLAKFKPHDIAVIDTDGINTAAIIEN